MDTHEGRRDFIIGVTLSVLLAAAAAWFARERIAEKVQGKGGDE
jgi:hypothetical protein